MSAAWMLAQALAAAPVFGTPPVPDEALAELRGGIELPNGIDLTLTVQTQTAIDGAVVLQTVFALVDGPPRIGVYAPPSGQAAPAVPSSSVGGAAEGLPPSVAFDGGTGVQVTPGFKVLPVIVGRGASTAPTIIAGLVPTEAAIVVTDAGVIERSRSGAPQAVSLAGPDFSVTHYLGGAFGSAIANSGSDRTITTVTTVSIDLRNAGPEVLGSALLRVEDLSVGALTTRF